MILSPFPFSRFSFVPYSNTNLAFGRGKRAPRRNLVMGMKNLRALDQGFKGTWDDPTIKKKRFLYMLSDSGL